MGWNFLITRLKGQKLAVVRMAGESEVDVEAFGGVGGLRAVGEADLDRCGWGTSKSPDGVLFVGFAAAATLWTANLTLGNCGRRAYRPLRTCRSTRREGNVFAVVTLRSGRIARRTKYRTSK